MAKTINQSHYGKLEVDNSEKDMVQIWNYDPRHPNADPQVVFIERDKVEKLFEMLREANEEFYNKQPPVRTNLPGDPPAGKKQRPDVF